MTIETSVLKRYSQGAQLKQEDLCCPVDYDPTLLALLPDEIIEKDYGCGDPSRYVRKGDTVLDLGSGSGKICYMAAQLVGAQGQVIGVDMNDDMLTLARKYQNQMAHKIGSDRVRFVKGQIQDLALDMALLDEMLAEQPIANRQGLISLHLWQQQQRAKNPLIADNSIDLVVSNCVLNLVDDSEKEQMVQEIFRVVKPGGRVAIADIVSDELVPEHLKKDGALWSGCIAGALQELEFLQAFINAGFIAVAYDKWGTDPWQVVEEIEFRTTTITAIKPEQQPCLDKGHAVIYRGPYVEVCDDEGHIYPRGQRIATCERSFKLLTNGVYKDDFIGIIPKKLFKPKTWCAPAGTIRPATETKGGRHHNQNTQEHCC